MKPPPPADAPLWRSRLRAAFQLERPVAATHGGRRLRRVIVATAVTVVLVEAINLAAAEEPGFSLFVRTFWALLRVVGFLLLLRAVRYGRAAARPFGLILAVTTVFAVARLTEPRQGSLIPPYLVLLGFVVLSVLCGALVWLLFRSAAIQEHLSGRPVRRHIPGWVLTARVAALSYGALTLVPFLVALGTVFGGEHRRSPAVTLVLLEVWFVLFLLLGFVLPVGALFLLRGHRWARWLVGGLSVLVAVAQPLLCLALLGLDGLLRDGVALVVTAGLGLYALHRSRGQDTWVRPNPGTTPTGTGAGEPSVTDFVP
jgi:hypothetical protein